MAGCCGHGWTACLRSQGSGRRLPAWGRGETTGVAGACRGGSYLGGMLMVIEAVGISLDGWTAPFEERQLARQCRDTASVALGGWECAYRRLYCASRMCILYVRIMRVHRSGCHLDEAGHPDIPISTGERHDLSLHWRLSSALVSAEQIYGACFTLRQGEFAVILRSSRRPHICFNSRLTLVGLSSRFPSPTFLIDRPSHRVPEYQHTGERPRARKYVPLGAISARTSVLFLIYSFPHAMHLVMMARRPTWFC